MSESRLWAVVPVKRFAAAKSRLHPVLTASECAELAKHMLQDVLTTLTACPDILSDVIVVTSDTEVAETARHSGARILLQPIDSGIDTAILHAIEMAAASTEAGVIVVPSDLPQLTGAAIAQAAAAIASPRSMAIAAAEDGGTNLIACRPASLLAPRFGPDSFETHRRVAAGIGLNVRILNLPELALDIDQPWHLEKFLAMHTKTRTHEFLSRREIAEATI